MGRQGCSKWLVKEAPYMTGSPIKKCPFGPPRGFMLSRLAMARAPGLLSHLTKQNSGVLFDWRPVFATDTACTGGYTLFTSFLRDSFRCASFIQ